MSMVQEAISQAKALKERVVEAIDAFRPKILIKEPLTEISPLKKLGLGESLSGEGIIEALRTRIESIRERLRLGLFRETVSGASVSCRENVQTQPIGTYPKIIEEKKNKKEVKGIHY